MTTHEYAATATRAGKWWIIEVSDLGTTQAHSATEAQAMTQDLVATMLDVPLADVGVSMTFEVGGVLGYEVHNA